MIFFFVFPRDISIPPFHEIGQLVEEGKFHESLGIKISFLIARVTIARPTNPPIIDGNSGPRKIPVITYGIVKLNAGKLQTERLKYPLTKIYFFQKSCHYYNYK